MNKEVKIEQAKNGWIVYFNYTSMGVEKMAFQEWTDLIDFLSDYLNN